MLSVQSVNLMSQPVFGKENKNKTQKPKETSIIQEQVYSDAQQWLKETVADLEELKKDTPEKTHGFLNFLVKSGKAAVAGVGMFIVAHKGTQIAGEYVSKAASKIPPKYKPAAIVNKLTEKISANKYGKNVVNALIKAEQKILEKLPKMPKIKASTANKYLAVILGVSTGVSTLVLPDKTVLDSEVEDD